MYKKKSESEKKILNPTKYSWKQIESICNVITDTYIDKFVEKEGMLPTNIDIESLVVNQLGCKIVYENLDDAADSLGFSANGIEKCIVTRDGQRVEVVFPKDTIVLDNYLLTIRNYPRKRFVLAHEAGHIIKSRIAQSAEARYCHSNDVPVKDRKDLISRFSISEAEANNFAASLLMPENLVKILMNRYYGNQVIYKYSDDILDPADVDNICAMAKELCVSYTAMYFRLKRLGLIQEGVIETFVEENVLGEGSVE